MLYGSDFLRFEKGERRSTPLVSMFISKYASEFGKHDVSLSDAARELLLLYSWPGNIRQLSHEMRRLVALSSSESVIDVDDLDSEIRGPSTKSAQLFVPGAPCISVRIDRKLSDIVSEIEWYGDCEGIGISQRSTWPGLEASGSLTERALPEAPETRPPLTTTLRRAGRTRARFVPSAALERTPTVCFAQRVPVHRLPDSKCRAKV